jgi:predicted histone-like DNA-binding protein
MPIFYKPVERKNPAKPLDPAKFYASASAVKRTDLKELAQSISDKSTTVSHIDVHAVLLALTDEIAARIPAGETIHLGDLGYFFTTLKSEGMEKLEDVNSATIKEARVRFAAGKDLEAKVKTAEFKKVSGQ